MYIFLFIVGAVIVAILYWYVLFYRYFAGTLSVPKAPMIPVLGSVAFLRRTVEVYWDLHKWTVSIGGGKLMRGVLGYHFCLNIADPQMLEYVMTHTSALNKSHLYKFLHAWLKTGLLTGGDEKWRIRRKLLTPAYHFRILSQFVDIFDKNSEILIDKLQIEVGKDKFDIYPHMSLCALDIICETAMGTTINAQLNETSDLVRATKQLNRITVSRMVSFLKQYQLTYFFTPDYRMEKKCLKIAHDYTMSVINSRRKELLNGIVREEEILDNDEIGYKKRIPFLDLLLQTTYNGVPLSDEDVQEEVNTFMFEGHDTVSAGISFAIYAIAKYPTIQKKIIEEQRLIYGDKPNRATILNDLQEMKYLEMTIKETLRLFPSVPLIGRVVSEDFKYGDLVLNEGLQLGLAIYTLHRNPDIYPNPELFDPERFTPENMAKRHPFSYIPFSAGFRNCVGQKFAMLEMKSTISKLLRNFVVTEVPEHKLELKSELVLNSASGVVVHIERRNW